MEQECHCIAQLLVLSSAYSNNVEKVNTNQAEANVQQRHRSWFFAKFSATIKQKYS